jgi:hypothetical protein
LLFATFFNSEWNFFLLSFATTTPLIRLQELKNHAFPNSPRRAEGLAGASGLLWLVERVH